MTQVNTHSVLRNQPYLLYYVRTSAPYQPRGNVQKCSSSPSLFSQMERTSSPSRPIHSPNGRPKNDAGSGNKFKQTFEPKDRVISAFNRPQDKKPAFIGPSPPTKNGEKRKNLGIVASNGKPTKIERTKWVENLCRTLKHGKMSAFKRTKSIISKKFKINFLIANGPGTRGDMLFSYPPGIDVFLISI